jgi:hypothetical protein
LPEPLYQYVLVYIDGTIHHFFFIRNVCILYSNHNRHKLPEHNVNVLNQNITSIVIKKLWSHLAFGTEQKKERKSLFRITNDNKNIQDKETRTNTSKE